MKKIFIMAVLAVFAATSALAAVSVVGSKHDMVASGFASAPVGGSTEVCIFCHTPHGAQTSVTQAPLWNNTAAANLVLTDIYTSSTMNYTVTAGQINATDVRLCLACHDSAVGMPVNQPNNGDMVTTGLALSANAQIGAGSGTDKLTNDHPIGMDLIDGTDPYIKLIGTITGPLGFNEDVFYGESNTAMWCSTCHDVHDGDPNMKPFLRISNVGSAMCKACHSK